MNKWIEVEDFKEYKTSGLIWIWYKRRIYLSQYDYLSEMFFFVEGHGCYMTECISKVMRIVKPEPPTELEREKEK